MASSSNSSLTSTSHTMTACPSQSNTCLPSNFDPGLTLCDTLAPQNRHLFITPTSALYVMSLELAKNILDKSAGILANEQAQKIKETRKRKRGNSEPDASEQVLKIKKIYTQGFEIENVWEQARRVIDALKENAEKNFNELTKKGVANAKADIDEQCASSCSDEESETWSEDKSAESVSEHNLALEQCNSPKSDTGFEGKKEENFPEEILKEDYRDDSTENEHNSEREDENDNDDMSVGVYQEDTHGLNDGFFLIDEFNRQTELLELDGGGPDNTFGEADDEEEIDWDVNPFVGNEKPTSSSRRLAAMEIENDENLSEEDEDLDKDGPTFGNMSLEAPSGESDREEDNNEREQIDDSNRDNANDIMYDDFFLPPSKKVGKGERQAKYLERKQRKSKVSELVEREPSLERTIANVRKDLFDDKPAHEDSTGALSDENHSDSKSRRSNHGRKQAKIIEQIRRLEAASIAPREWTLTGEARATDRPLNSLIETDLDFESTGKPVMETTAEISEDIEGLIKRRILAKEFDEVIRRRPNDLSKIITRRGVFDLDDSKPQQSLADIYAEEYVKAKNPDTYISKVDEKLQREENEIEALWKNVSAKLDALSNWHYKPKPVAPSLTVVSDVATIAMEDAQPTTGNGINGSESMLAPQEVYKAGKNKDAVQKGEVVLRSDIPIARQEMTREQKIRRRRREKERISKRGGHKINTEPRIKQGKNAGGTLSDLKIGGVKIIGKKGDLRDVKGNKLVTKTRPQGANVFKL